MWRRRDVFAALLAIGIVAGSLGIAQEQPNRHTEGGFSGPIVESPEAMKVTGVILCFCGGCVNQTLHECTCGMAANERAKVAAELAAGAAPESLIARYITEHGPQVRVVPERKGLNLIGWAIPFLAAATGVAALFAVLVAWRRRDAAAANAAPAPQPGELDRAYRERIERDLRETS